MHGEVFKGGSRNSSTFKMELFVTIGSSRNLQRASSYGLTTNRQAKLKMDENGHALKVAPDTLSSFVDMFSTFFHKCRLLFHYYSVSVQKLITKMKTSITVNFIFWGSGGNYQNVV